MGTPWKLFEALAKLNLAVQCYERFFAEATPDATRVAELEKELRLCNSKARFFEHAADQFKSRIKAAVEKIQWWHQAFGCPDSSVDILRAVEDILTPDAEPSGKPHIHFNADEVGGKFEVPGLASKLDDGH